MCGPVRQPPLHYHTRSVRRRAASFKRAYRRSGCPYPDVRQMHTKEGLVNLMKHQNTSGPGCVYRRGAGNSLPDAFDLVGFPAFPTTNQKVGSSNLSWRAIFANKNAVFCGLRQSASGQVYAGFTGKLRACRQNGHGLCEMVTRASTAQIAKRNGASRLASVLIAVRG